MVDRQDVWVVSGVRTAIGDYGSGLKSVAVTDLAKTAAQEALRRSQVDPEQVEQSIFGQVIHTNPRDVYLPRLTALNSGLAKTSIAYAVNRICGSGLQAICQAADAITLGHAAHVLAGGAESMSNALYASENVRWGAKMGNMQLFDMMLGPLTDPFDGIHMGITAENLAEKYGISREDQDLAALQSHQRAVAAVKAGFFKEQIVPVEIPARKGLTTIFDQDEHVRSALQLGDLSRLRPVFKKDGTVTAGNASSLNDGAAAVVLSSTEQVEKQALQPLGRLVAYAHAGVEPGLMGYGPVPAVQRVLASAGLKLEEIDVIESNEAFAAQCLSVARGLDLNDQRVNPNGGAIALGHPIGATGAILVVKALYELRRTGGRYALVTMCIGGGQGIAAIFERA